MFTSVILPTITLILGVVLGTGFTAYVSRPKLKPIGGGGGANGISLTLMNSPGFIGLALQETIILGKRITNGVYKGVPIERASANECVAHLYDKETGDIIGLLYWRLKSDAGRIVSTCSIKSGEQVDLMLFARKADDPVKYFVYRPNGTSPGPLVPPDHAMLSDTRSFFVRIQYSYGRQKLEANAKVRRTFDGHLWFESETFGCSF